MRYYEITPESPAHELSVKVWEQPKVWQKANSELEALIGCETDKNIAYCPERLCLCNVPKELDKQFTAYGQLPYRRAKLKSEVNTKFLEIAARYGLYNISIGDVAWALGTRLQRGQESYHPPMDGKYYIQTERQIENDKGLVEITEPAFLRMRADWLEQKEKAAGQ